MTQGFPAWQPIESAPKDGSIILAYRRDCGVFCANFVAPADMLPDDLAVEESDFEPSWFTPDGISLQEDMEFTHWMPLPEPPI